MGNGRESGPRAKMATRPAKLSLPPALSTPPAAHVMRHAAQAVQHGPRDRGLLTRPAPLSYHHYEMGPMRCHARAWRHMLFFLTPLARGQTPSPRGRGEDAGDRGEPHLQVLASPLPKPADSPRSGPPAIPRPQSHFGPGPRGPAGHCACLPVLSPQPFPPGRQVLDAPPANFAAVRGLCSGERMRVGGPNPTAAR